MGCCQGTEISNQENKISSNIEKRPQETNRETTGETTGQNNYDPNDIWRAGGYLEQLRNLGHEGL